MPTGVPSISTSLSVISHRACWRWKQPLLLLHHRPRRARKRGGPADTALQPIIRVPMDRTLFSITPWSRVSINIPNLHILLIIFLRLVIRDTTLTHITTHGSSNFQSSTFHGLMGNTLESGRSAVKNTFPCILFISLVGTLCHTQFSWQCCTLASNIRSPAHYRLLA